jgi:hypothetical protein
MTCSALRGGEEGTGAQETNMETAANPQPKPMFDRDRRISRELKLGGKRKDPAT